MSHEYPVDIDARFSTIFSGARYDKDWIGILPETDPTFVTDTQGNDAPSRFQFVLDVEGVAISTERPYTLLASGAALFRQSSGIQPWLYSYPPSRDGELRPFEHYIPVAADLSNLAERLKWAREHERECSEIAARAANWSRSWFHREYAFEYVYHLLAETTRLRD